MMAWDIGRIVIIAGVCLLKKSHFKNHGNGRGLTFELNDAGQGAVGDAFGDVPHCLLLVLHSLHLENVLCEARTTLLTRTRAAEESGLLCFLEDGIGPQAGLHLPLEDGIVHPAANVENQVVDAEVIK